MEFKEALLELYTTLSESIAEDTDKVGVTFQYLELPGVTIRITFTTTNT